MKADLTKPENKRAFRAQYIDQRVLQHPSWNIIHTNVLRAHWLMLDEKEFEGFFLSLRPISSLTDPEAKIVCEIFDVDYCNTDGTDSHFDLAGATEWIEALFTEPAGYYIDGYTGDQLLQAIDCLRSIGIALPYLGIPVEEWVKAGVVVIREAGA